MRLLDYDRYVAYGGELSQVDFEKLLPLAEAVINKFTYNRLIKYDELPDIYIGPVGVATFYQLEYISRSGGYDSLLGTLGVNSIKSESLGNHSVTYNLDSNKALTVDGISLNPLAANELDKVYLRYRGINC